MSSRPSLQRPSHSSSLIKSLVKTSKAILFDFDGLIFDSEWAAFDAWSTVYREYDATLNLDDYIQCVGSGYHRFNPAENLIKKKNLDLTADVLIALKDTYKKNLCSTLRPLAGVQRFIEAVASAHDNLGSAKKQTVVSSSHKPWVVQNLESLGLSRFFSSTTTGDEVEHIKPAPDLYLLGAQRLGVEPKDCLVFEDSQNGLVAAKAAGMPCIVVPNRITRVSTFESADATIRSFQDIEF